MLLLYAWVAAPYLVQTAIDRLSVILNEPAVLGVLRRVALEVGGCG